MIFGATPEAVRVGIGDDAAVLGVGDASLAWSVDVVVEGVHFRRDWLTPRELGFKATMAAASDLAAMGARPLGALASLVLPASMSDADMASLAEGQAAACTAIGASVIGGNLARGSELSVTTTVLGICDRVLRREGARAGDTLWCAGPLGLAAAGLRALLAGRSEDRALQAAIAAWRQPVARIAEGLRAVALAHAAIDVSDGLSLDAARLLGASLDLVMAPPVSADLGVAARALSVDAQELVLSGGEDYALLVAAPDDATLEGFSRIGRFEKGSGVLWLEQEGERRRIEPRGFDHFAS